MVKMCFRHILSWCDSNESETNRQNMTSKNIQKQIVCVIMWETPTAARPRVYYRRTSVINQQHRCGYLKPGGGSILSVPKTWLMLFLLLSAAFWINWYFACLLVFLQKAERTSRRLSSVGICFIMMNKTLVKQSENTHRASPRARQSPPGVVLKSLPTGRKMKPQGSSSNSQYQ